MTDMFIPKKEKILITIEAIIYIILIVLGAYFTICGNLFIRMIPMLYIIGIFGVIMFNKPVVTVLLGTISIFTFGALIENSINLNIVLLAIYSAIMIGFGVVTGHILNVLSQNIKLRKFIKYYRKIGYVVALVITVILPVILNNIVNSNMISYIVAKNNISEYINRNYGYSECYIAKTEYIPSYNGGEYEFTTMIDNTEVKLRYNKKEIVDVNLINRKEQLNKIINASMNIFVKENNVAELDVKCRYEYSKIATIPDIIQINISNVQSLEMDNLLTFINSLKNWEYFNDLNRIDIQIDDKAVSINKKDLKNKNITEEYILNGMKQETLNNKEGI